jgi:hypothetical protein
MSRKESHDKTEADGLVAAHHRPSTNAATAAGLLGVQRNRLTARGHKARLRRRTGRQLEQCPPHEECPAAARWPLDGLRLHGWKDDLFGGKGNRSHYFNDIWAYTPATTTWHELTPTSILPPGRFGHSIVYDPADRELLLFGGVVGTTGQPANDLWTYSFKSNTWAHLHPADAGPPARTYPSMAYDLPPAKRSSSADGPAPARSATPGPTTPPPANGPNSTPPAALTHAGAPRWSTIPPAVS